MAACFKVKLYCSYGKRVQLVIPSMTVNECSWCPPPASRFKLNFDAAIFLDYKCLGVGVIIRNEKGEVMRAMSTKGPWCLIVMK